MIKLLKITIKLLKKIKQFYSDISNPVQGSIYMLHRIDDFEDGNLWPNENMKITPDFLENFIQQNLKKNSFIRFEDIPSFKRKLFGKKFICFTIDDGYKDNYTKGLPVFKKYNVPFTIFITTCFPDKTAILWWYELEDLLLKNNSIFLSNGKNYVTNTYDEKCTAFMQIREEILKLNQNNLESELSVLFSNYNINWKSKCENLCLSWEDINILLNEPLVTLGSHTKNHFNLKELVSEQEVTSQIKDGICRFFEKTNFKQTVFAYPFGSENEVSSREIEILKNLKIQSCLAYGGNLRKKDLTNLYSLPRIMLNQNN